MRLKETVGVLRGRLESQQDEITNLRLRVEFLECEHEYVPDEITRFKFGWNGGWATHSPYKSYVLKCSKCGHILKDITEKEYLLAKLESDKNSCEEQYEETMARLADLEKEE